MEGWIKSHRKILDSKFGRDLEMIGLFTALIMKANHKNGFTRDGTLIKRGQFMASQDGLAKLFGIDRSTLRRRLAKFVDAQQIELRTNSQNTVITILNYDQYQGDEHQVNINRTSSEHRVTTNKNNKNNKNKKNKGKGENNFVYDFEKIYSEYPKKAGKSRGIELCHKQITNDDQYAFLMQAVINYKTECEVESRDRKYIKQFSTFMNKTVWVDYIEMEAETKFGGTDTPEETEAKMLALVERATKADAEMRAARDQ